MDTGIHPWSDMKIHPSRQEFTSWYTDYDPETCDYRHIPFFAAVKDRLAV
ncbi:hypothetical protein [Mycobacterium simiae]|nr:hypothetical protein [Mycobacterium simiae]